MCKVLTKSTFTVGLLVMLMAVPALGATINKSVKIEAGTEASGASSVNGSISVGEGATVTGALRTVNGTIRVDARANIEKAATVNGGIRIAEGVQSGGLKTTNGSIRVAGDAVISGAIEATNGRIDIGKDSVVTDGISNVNGQIRLSGAEVGGNLRTVKGDIDLEDVAVVKGDLIVDEDGSWDWGKARSRKPRIVIGPGSRVEGKVVLKQEVDLFISETAEVGGVEGEMSVADAVRFSGDRP